MAEKTSPLDTGYEELSEYVRSHLERYPPEGRVLVVLSMRQLSEMALIANALHHVVEVLSRMAEDWAGAKRFEPAPDPDRDEQLAEESESDDGPPFNGRASK